VGKDQQQHLEITRDIASAFNNQYGETFVIPEAKIDKTVMTVPGIDGNKMSKSYNNTIDIFLPKKQLRKRIMSIVTDSTPLEEPKDPDKCNVFALYSLLASEEEVSSMRNNYQGGNYGYGHAKQALFELIISQMETERATFDHYMENTEELIKKLENGESKARDIGRSVLSRVKEKIGF